MKYTYMSEREFHLKCPCGYNLTQYAETLTPSGRNLDFVKAEKSTEENTYTAIYDVLLPGGTTDFELEVSCTMVSSSDWRYKLIRKS